jgi:predicted Zn finger-like uncharacterized protein
MYYVLCPYCQAKVEIPDDAVGTDRTDPWNVVRCAECDASFDYDDDEVATGEDAS